MTNLFIISALIGIVSALIGSKRFNFFIAKILHGHTPIIYAIVNHDLLLAEKYLGQGADINACDKKGRTPLMFAAGLSNSPEFIKLFIDAGAFVNATNMYGDTPLMYAAANTTKSNIGIVSLLIEAGAHINTLNKRGNNALLIAVSNSIRDVAKLLIERGSDLNTTNYEGQNALSIAVNKNDIEMVKLLMKSDVNEN